MTAIAAFCFLVYRACLAFQITNIMSLDYVFLPADSWHKLSNIFMLIEYCSLIVYLSRIPKEKSGYFIATGTAIIIILQEKDSFSYQYALVPLIFNNLVLICSNFTCDSPGSYNKSMVMYGALWYVISCIGCVLTFSEQLDYYFVFDDLFMVATSFSLFYSWQSFNIAPPDHMSENQDVVEVNSSTSKDGVQKVTVGPKIIFKPTIGLA